MLVLQIEILSVLSKNKDENSKLPPIKFLTRDKTDKDAANLKTLVTAIKDSKKGATIGVYSKDKFDTDFVSAFRKAMKEFPSVSKIH